MGLFSLPCLWHTSWDLSFQCRPFHPVRLAGAIPAGCHGLPSPSETFLLPPLLPLAPLPPQDLPAPIRPRRQSPRLGRAFPASSPGDVAAEHHFLAEPTVSTEHCQKNKETSKQTNSPNQGAYQNGLPKEENSCPSGESKVKWCKGTGAEVSLHLMVTRRAEKAPQNLLHYRHKC